MASIRTARVLAAVAALPLTAALFMGVASADNDAFANNDSNAAAASIGDRGVGHDNNGNSSVTQQQAVGSRASNQNTTTQVNRSAFTAIRESEYNAGISFFHLW